MTCSPGNFIANRHKFGVNISPVKGYCCARGKALAAKFDPTDKLRAEIALFGP